MQDRNPYAAPQTNVARADGVEEYGEIRDFLGLRPHRPRALHRLHAWGSRFSSGIFVAIAVRR